MSVGPPTLIHINDFKKIFKNNLNTIYTKPYNICSSYILNYLNKIKYIVCSYENKEKYEHLDIIAKIIPFIPDQVNNIKAIMIQINACLHGQTILNKYKDTITNILSIDNLIYIIQDSAHLWSFPIYKFYINILKSHDSSIIDSLEDINNIMNRLLITSFCNKDDRIYRDIINEEFILKRVVFNDTIIETLITNSMRSFTPSKYILRRLRYLNVIIPDLHKYFNIILKYIINNNLRLDILNPVMKYYYTKTTQLNEELYNIVKIFSNIHIEINYTFIFHNLYEQLNTDVERNILVLYNLLEHGHTFNKGIINGDMHIKVLKPLLQFMFKHIDVRNIMPLLFYNIIDFKNVMSSFSLYNISSCFPFSDINNKYVLFFMMPFIVANSGTNYTKFNKIRYCISKYIRNIRQKKAIIRKLKIYPILNELKSLKPNMKVSIFKDGTNFYKINKQKFNFTPPAHIFPGQLQNLDSGEYFIKEKADGILVDTLPKDIYPNILCNYTKLKAEYIEDLDLYLVFDIDIVGSTYERHMHIHSLHTYGQTNIITINSIEEFIDNINIERKKLGNFLKEPYDNYRWYPKPAWKICVNMIGEHCMTKCITDIINDTDGIVDWLCNDINMIKYDGLIITPLNGSIELKVKPKKFYTIDLLFKDNKWIDRDNIEYNILIDDEVKLICSNNTIMRCYPIMKDNMVLYYAKEIRHDKLKPNPFKIVATIMDLYNVEYKYSYDNIYHDLPKIHNYSYWFDIVSYNRNMIKKMINMIEEINPNADIIDFGCGNARALCFLTNYNTYMGIDMDVNMLGKAITSSQSNTKATFGYCDLTDIDKSNLLKRSEICNVILCINSIMHFFNDTFFMKLKNIMKPNSLILFNVVEMENNLRLNLGLNLDDKHFIERKDDMVYYKFPIHNDIKKEPYIDNDMIQNKLSYYKWTIINTFTSTDDNMTKLYKWYLIKN